MMKFSVRNLGKLGETLSLSLPECFTQQSGIEIFMVEGEISSISKNENSYQIQAALPSERMRLLGNLITGEETVSEPPVTERGIMLDASRYAVPTVHALKRMLLKLSLCGLNRFCLYTEDTYPVDGEPLFGYGRGSYTKQELRELDDFAHLLGIEMFPCIQTLGHFEQVLRYAPYMAFQDNPRVVNTASDAVYGWLEKLIANASEPYRSKRIHIGMDEPWGLGRGKAFNFAHPRTAGECFVSHAKRMAQICDRLGLQPMFWGDYVLGHSGEEALSAGMLEDFPRSLQAVYWDYETLDTEVYAQNIDALQQLGFEVICAPGAHNYNRFFPDFAGFEKKTFPFIRASIEKGVKSMLLACWGDDGHECLNRFAEPVMIQFLAQTCALSETQTETRVKLLCGFSTDELEALGRLAEPEISSDKVNFTLNSKMLLYDDPLLRFAGRLLSGQSLREAEVCLRNAPPSEWIPNYASFILEKTRLSFEVKALYDAKDRSEAALALPRLTALIEEAGIFYARYREAWLAERKPFGLEIIDQRFGGMILRLKIWHETVQKWVSGELETIAEYENQSVPEGLSKPDLSFHNRLFTRCYQLWG